MTQDNKESIQALLKKFLEQRDNGSITQDEFDAQKKILLLEIKRLDSLFLKTYAELRKKGQITQEEFDELKQKLTVFEID